MTRAEWERRFKARIIAVSDVSDGVAEDEFKGMPFEDLSMGFEDDPEGAADEAMSYWDD